MSQKRLSGYIEKLYGVQLNVERKLQKKKDNEGIALFPEVFKGDYHNFTPWLVYSCLVWCGNVRDIFSAGGNKFIDDSGIYVSAVMYRALENVEEIKLRILDMTDEEILGMCD